MEHHANVPLIDTSVSALDMETILASFSDDAGLSRSLRSASVLIMPTDLGSEYEGPAFPISTPEIFRLLRAGFDDKASVEVAIRDEDYKEFDYRFDSLILPVLYISKHFLVPLAVSLLGAFIYNKFKNRRRSTASTIVKSEIHFIDSAGAQVNIKYEGPADTYEKTTIDHLRKLGVRLDGEQPPDDND